MLHRRDDSENFDKRGGHSYDGSSLKRQNHLQSGSPIVSREVELMNHTTDL